MSDTEPIRGLLQGDHTPGVYDAGAIRSTDIRLDTQGDCPRCTRPLAGLAYGGCSYCGAHGPWFQALPAVAGRLASMAPGWTVERLLHWAAPRPAHLAWAAAHERWETLSTWVHEGFRGDLARLEMSLRGRGIRTQVEDVSLSEIRLEAIHDFEPWLTLRLEGRRAAYLVHPDGTSEDGSSDPRPFVEFWRLAPTGRAERDQETCCSACGGPGGLEDRVCFYCGCAIVREPGPWLLEGILAPRSLEGAPGSGNWYAGGRPPRLPSAL